MADRYLVECPDCHLLILSPYPGFRRCDYDQVRATERAEAQERLDRQNERHHVSPPR